ncbi:VCBS repeat-containing protein [Chryseolinea sp. H1M3-3]|uniref:VCBS repeat-containing protein n=1 Tax=Chryseolinea sp. H1M3-3 TaxID=3034144 RepID=UPI0023EC1581|nr:VCBS repeat-containing protein [Chryseolinea sp. H1M3-3]
MSSTETGIAFVNKVETTDELNVFRYRNFYNGGGVGLADFNNDGLSDVFLTSNMGPNRLFINKGDWKFEDITEPSGIAGTKAWSTGVSVVDINADGFLDIYVCNAGDVKNGNRENELFINNGNLTFKESAAQYGLADKGFGTHAAFFDYDKDGDLDCYVLNNSYKPVSSLGYRNLRNVRDEFGGHKLYRNDNNKFVDVSESAGIFGSVIGFGLGVTVGDVNQDSWPDIYISNDFYERDYLYINNGDGTFNESLEKYMGHISMFSMGADLADLNNDGYPEIFSTDMLPEDDIRLKTLTAFETYDVYQLRIRNGYYHQFMRNMLHLNNRDGSFTEMGELAGVSATDWSWGALIADFNNDQHKEIFVCNGIYKDLINQDFVEYLGSSDQMRTAIEGKEIDFEEFTEKMPSQKLSNFLFAQQDDLQFKNKAKEWGLDEPSFSNGAAYGDLDNDGDLDLVVNNVNQEVFVYQNRSRELNQNNYLAFSFKGNKKNVFGLGATVQAYVDSGVLAFDHMPIRGFQSSMDYKIIIGLGKLEQVDSLVVTWPDRRVQIMKDVKANQLLTVSNEAAKDLKVMPARIVPLLSPVKNDSIVHYENTFNDFDRDRLKYHMLSTQGPAFAKADINKDGLDDFYLGGSAGYTGAIYIQQADNKFNALSEVFAADSAAEDVAAVFFDADNDEDLDLYVVTGGTENTTQSIHQVDRLYVNEGIKNGTPVFEKSTDRIPLIYQSGSCVKPADVDNDGDIDLFVGTRLLPSYYGLPCDQVLLVNDGTGTFRDQTVTLAPQLKQLGMVTDAHWFDYDKNGFSDLLIIGEWMPVTLFMNDGKKLMKAEKITGVDHSEGWWNRLKAVDIDNDGDEDFVLGNLGLNSIFKPNASAPVSLYVSDFDKNGSIEPIFIHNTQGREFPFALRQDIIKQIPSLKKEFVFYKDYADKTIEEVVDKASLKKAHKLQFYEPHTSLLVNNGTKGFKLKHLPVEAQYSPVYGIEVFDVDGDHIDDLIIGGNLFAVKPEVGRYDGLRGLVLKNDGHGNFKPLSSIESGLAIEGEVRHISTLNSKANKTLTFIRNNNTVVFYRIK